MAERTVQVRLFWHDVEVEATAGAAEIVQGAVATWEYDDEDIGWREPIEELEAYYAMDRAVAEAEAHSAPSFFELRAALAGMMEEWANDSGYLQSAHYEGADGEGMPEACATAERLLERTKELDDGRAQAQRFAERAKAFDSD